MSSVLAAMRNIYGGPASKDGHQKEINSPCFTNILRERNRTSCSSACPFRAGCRSLVSVSGIVYVGVFRQQVSCKCDQQQQGLVAGNEGEKYCMIKNNPAHNSIHSRAGRESLSVSSLPAPEMKISLSIAVALSSSGLYPASIGDHQKFVEKLHFEVTY